MLVGMRARSSRLDVSALYLDHREPLLLFFVRRTGDAEAALDLWAETFAQAVKSSASYDGSTPEQAAGWLYGIARKLLAGYQRRGSIERRALQRLQLERPVATPEVLAAIEHRAGLSDLREVLADALADLSPGVRAAVQQRVVEERPYSEIARSLGTTEQAVRARVSRGLSALADALDQTAVVEALR
jgi:RNA polymerase sigma-70 factor (ECF subfamily)